MELQINHPYVAYIGIDWADQKHDVCLQAVGADEREFSVLTHRPDTIAAWATSLKQRFHGQPIAICLEIAKGPLVYALQKYDFLVLYPVNPSTVAKYRQAFTPSNAKDDPSDAQLQLELLMQHRDKLKPLYPQGVEMRTLQCLVEQRRGLVDDRVRVTNQLIGDHCCIPVRLTVLAGVTLEQSHKPIYRTRLRLLTRQESVCNSTSPSHCP